MITFTTISIKNERMTNYGEGKTYASKNLMITLYGNNGSTKDVAYSDTASIMLFVAMSMSSWLVFGLCIKQKRMKSKELFGRKEGYFSMLLFAALFTHHSVWNLVQDLL